MQLCPLMAGLRPQTAFSRDQLQPGFNPPGGTGRAFTEKQTAPEERATDTGHWPDDIQTLGIKRHGLPRSPFALCGDFCVSPSSLLRSGLVLAVLWVPPCRGAALCTHPDPSAPRRLQMPPLPGRKLTLPLAAAKPSPDCTLQNLSQVTLACSRTVSPAR